MGSSRGLGTWASAVRGRARFHQPVGVDRSLARCRKREGERPEQDPGEGWPLAPRPQDAGAADPSRTPGKAGPWHHGPRTAGAGRGRGSKGTVCLISGHTLGLCLASQSYLTLCNPTDSSPPGSSVHGDSPGKTTGVGCFAFLQGIFPTQGLNPGLLHCRWISFPAEPPRKPTLGLTEGFLKKSHVREILI